MEKKYVKYLVSNIQDKQWGLEITTVGHQNILPYTSYPPQIHPSPYLFSTEKGRVLSDYQLVYITRGRGRFASAHCQECEIKEGDMFLLFPNEWHNYKPDPKTGWHESWIGFTGENIRKKIESHFFSLEKVVFKIGIQEQLYNLYYWANIVAQNQDPGYQQILAGIASLLLGVAYSKSRQEIFQDKQTNALVSKAKILMAENIGQNFLEGGKAIAQHIGVGYSWFRHIFKEYTGFSPNQYVIELKISKSKELLINTNLTCQQISDMVGFETPSYFSIMFKKKVGFTPIEYRKFHRAIS